MNPLAELLGIELEDDSTRTCNKCGETKPITAFGKNSYGAEKFRRKICIQCRNNSDKSKRDAIRKLGGKLIKPHVGTPCECCGIPMTHDKEMSGVCFDHDSVKEEFRGWICKKCNTSMGLHGDDIDGIKKIIVYLEGKQ